MQIPAIPVGSDDDRNYYSCEFLGKAAAEAAQARDAGVPLELYEEQVAANVRFAVQANVARRYQDRLLAQELDADKGPVEVMIEGVNTVISKVYAHSDWAPRFAEAQQLRPYNCRGNFRLPWETF